MKKFIAGSGSGGKGGGGSARVPSEAPDSLRSTAFARVLDLLSEGEIEGLVNGLQSVYLDGTPIQNPDGSFNFTGVTVGLVPGTQGQDFIPGFPDVEQERGVGVEVTAAVSVTKTITNPDIDAARVRLAIPGLTSQNPSNGDISGTSVQYAIDLQSNGGGFVAQPLTKIWVSSAPTATVLSTGISPTITWTPTLATDPETGLILYATIDFQVQYRVVGAGSWTTFLADSFTPEAGRPVDDPVPISRTYVIEDLASALYEVQVVKTSGDGSVAITRTEIYTPEASDTITGKTTSTYQRSKRIPLTGSPPWDLRVRRLTPDSTTVALRNKTVWDAYTEITEEKLTYPLSAVAGLIIDASQFSSIPVRGYEIKGLKIRIPSNYNPITRVYTGTWDGSFVIAWTNNPAWIFYDLVTTARYGLGRFLAAAQVDKWGLYTIGQYCDGLVPDGRGRMEPRFTCNLYLQTAEDAFQVVTSLASVFRGMVYWAAGALTPVQDAPADPLFLFTEANVEGGLFTYTGSAKAARHTVAFVSWNDPADGYKRRPEYVEHKAGILRYGINPIEVTAVGCTSRGQAHRVGLWLLYSEQNETELVTFRAGLEGTSLRPGAIVSVQDQHRAGIRFGGRLTAATASSVTVDKAVTIESGKTYTLQVVLPDGTLATKTVTNAPGSSAVLTITPNFAVTPLTPSVWILTASDLAPRLYRALAVAEVAKNQYEVTGLAHNPDKFVLIEQGLTLSTPRTSTIGIVPGTPQNIVISEYLYVAQGSVKTMLSVSWEAVTGASRYQVQYRRDQGNYVSLPEVSTPLAEATDVLPGRYDVLVVAVNVLGLKSMAASASKQLFGKTAPPADVAGFVVARNGADLFFSWKAVADLDTDHYELRRGDLWESAVPIGIAIGTSLTVTTNVGGNYLLKAVDTSGNDSLHAAVIAIPAKTDINVVVTTDEAPAWSGTKAGTMVAVGSVTFDGKKWTDLAAAWNTYTGSWVETAAPPSPIRSLTLAGTTTWTDLTAAWTSYPESWMKTSVPVSSGTYLSTPIDIGQQLTSRVEIEPVANQWPISDRWTDLTQPWLTYATPWTGPPGTVSIAYEMATSADGATYTPYAPFVPGFYTARYFQFRLTLTTTDPAFLPRLTSFTVTVDVPDRVLHFEDVSVPIAGVTLTFSPVFVNVQTIQGTLQGGAIGDTFLVTGKTNAEATVTIYDGGGSAKAGLVDVDVFGYGAVAV